LLCERLCTKKWAGVTASWDVEAAFAAAIVTAAAIVNFDAGTATTTTTTT